MNKVVTVSIVLIHVLSLLNLGKKFGHIGLLYLAARQFGNFPECRNSDFR